LQGYPDQVLQRHFIKRVREDAARDEKTGESYPGKAVLQYALHRYKVSPGRQNIIKNPDPSGSGVNEPLINFIRSKQFLH
jgi:hypothetical protein